MKTLIFVDLDNIYRGYLEFFGIEPGVEFFDDVRKLEEDKGNQILEVFAFADYGKIGNRSYRSRLEMNAVRAIDVFGANKQLSRKNASDVQMSIAAVDALYNYKDVENFVILSADSDMLPLIQYLKDKQKRVTLYVIGKQANVNLLKNHPNNGFYTLESALNLQEPKIPVEHRDDVINHLVSEIYQKEIYNKSKGNRLHQSYDNFKWRALRFIKVNGYALTALIIKEALIEAQQRDMLKIVYNDKIKMEEIILNHEHEIISKIS